jgi:hypothetical protein
MTIRRTDMEIPSSMQLCEGEAVDLREAVAKDANVRPFRMKAYTGAPVRTFFGQMVIDLAGLRLGRKRKPILQEHDRKAIVGFSETVAVEGNELHVTGKVIKGTAAGDAVITAADGGLPWQASMGLSIDKIRELDDGDTETVNGRNFKGPGLIVTKSRLRETSFVALGADEDTSGVVLGATEDGLVEVEHSKETDMPKDKGKDDAALSAEAVDKAKAEGADEAAKAGQVQLAALREAFPDRAEFVLDQMAKGHDVQAAKVELADILVKEQGEVAKKLAASEAKVAELTKKNDDLEAGHEGVPTNFGGDSADTSSMDVFALARHNWAKNVENCKTDFASFEVYEMFLKNEEQVAAKERKFAERITAAQQALTE